MLEQKELERLYKKLVYRIIDRMNELQMNYYTLAMRSGLSISACYCVLEVGKKPALSTLLIMCDTLNLKMEIVKDE